MWSKCVIQGIQSSASNPSVIVKSNERAYPSRTSLSDSDPYPTQIPIPYQGALLAPLQIRHCAYYRNAVSISEMASVCASLTRFHSTISDITDIRGISPEVYIGSISQWYVGSTSTGPDSCTKPRLNLPAISTPMYFWCRPVLGCNWWHPSMRSPSSYT